MLIVCCTQKLLKHLHLKPTVPSEPDTTALGEWYANLIQVGRRKWVLFVNAATRLAVVVPMASIETMVDAFRARLANLLDEIGVHEDDIDREMDAGASAAIARTTDRSVLGTMNVMARQFPHLDELAESAGENPEDNAEWYFAHEIQSPLGWRSPAAFVRMAFAEERPYIPPVEIAREFLGVEEVMAHEWEFRHHRIDADVTEMLLFALEVDRRYHVDEAQTMLATLIRDYPEFIDAYHHLAAIHSRAGDHDEAHELWWYAVEIGRAALPGTFRAGTDRLRWGLVENRPFLRAVHGLALDWQQRGANDRAIELYRELLELNPEDHQGARALLATAYLRRNDNDAALAICDRFPHDALPEVAYGRVLALLRLDRTDDARHALSQAIDVRPLVARELTAKRHSKPSPYAGERDYVANSYGEAAYYWHDCGELWEATPGALDFVAQYLAENPLPPRQADDNVIEFPGHDLD